MSSRDKAGVNLLPESWQTLLNSTIVQTDSRTILTFRRHLVEPNEIPIDGNGRTTFLWAHGFGNELSVHADHGAFDLTFHPCNIQQTKSNPKIVEIETPETYRSLRTAHGALGGIAWGVLVPLAIASSILTVVQDTFVSQFDGVPIHRCHFCSGSCGPRERNCVW